MSLLSSSRESQGPKYIEYINNIRNMKKNPCKFLEKGYKEHGECYSFSLLHKNLKGISSPVLAKQILNNNNQCFYKPSEILRPIIGNAMLSSEGDDWLKKRKLSQPFFHPKEIRKQKDIMTKQIDFALAEWSQSHGNSWPISSLMQRLTLAVVCKSFLKKDIWDIEPEIFQLMDHLYLLIKKKITKPINIPLWIPSPDNKNFNQVMSSLRSLVRSITNQHQSTTSEEQVLIDKLIKATDLDTGYQFTEQDLQDEVIQYFLAGHETTANLLSFASDLLAWNPSVQEKLRKELSSLDSDYPDMKDLPRLKMLHNIIHETLRLRPSVWYLLRACQQDCILQGEDGSYLFNKGDKIMISIWNIHQRPDLWENPQAFLPERMNHLKDMPENAFMPFGIGKASCIGNNFAIFEASLILSKLIRNYKISPISANPIEIESGLTLRPEKDVNLKIEAIH